MKTDLSNGQLYLDDDDEDSEEDENEDPKEPSWGNVPRQQSNKTYECKLCKTSFKSKNLLFKHLNEVNFHKKAIPNSNKRGAPDVPLVRSSRKWLNSVVYIGADEYNKVEAFAVKKNASRLTQTTDLQKIAKCTSSKLHSMANIEIGY